MPSLLLLGAPVSLHCRLSLRLCFIHLDKHGDCHWIQWVRFLVKVIFGLLFAVTNFTPHILSLLPIR